MGNIDGLFGILALACGVYCLYAVYTMKKTGEINQTVLLSKDINPKKCKDKDGYLKCVVPKVLTLGIVTTVYGILCLIDAYLVSLGLVILIILSIFFVVLIWYAVTTSKAAKQYF